MTSVYSRLRLNKDNFHQFTNQIFHKEKEMADFRKWLLALVAVGMLLGIGSTAAFAQGTTVPAAAAMDPRHPGFDLHGRQTDDPRCFDRAAKRSGLHQYEHYEPN